MNYIKLPYLDSEVLATRNLKTNEFKALHLCNSGDVWGFGRLTK